MLLLIDNYDSFTYNLVHYLGELGAQVVVKRNDALSVEEALSLGASAILLSPGPCDPAQAGICLALTEAAAAARVPLMGVCLGHQTIGQAFGGKIVHAGEIMHGKTSMIYHKDGGVFKGLSNPMEATRYHSLVIEKESLPEVFQITAWTENQAGELDEIMGVRHKELDIEGVQFHPESILTAEGHALLKNFLQR